MTDLPPLIGLAHGSRDPRSARVIGDVMAAVGALRPGLIATPAFLDLCDPDLTTAVAALRDRHGCDQAVVVPLLFSEAFHATQDAPSVIAQCQQATGVSLRTSPILGIGDDILELLEESAGRARIGQHEAIIMLCVGSSHPEANAGMHELALRWSERRVGPVWAAFATVGEPSVTDVLRWAEASGRRFGIVPLFLAPGLLLDQVARQAIDLEPEIAEPLGVTMAEVVLRRYEQARVRADA